MNIKKIGSALIAVALLASPMLAGAETATTSTSTNAQIQAMLLQIQTLQAQIKALQSLQAQIASTTQNISGTLSLIRNLKQGMTGDDVKALQAILAADPTIYSGEITGYFGRLTAEAVKKFQEKNGIESLGLVGPKTLKKLNEEAKKWGLSHEQNATTTEKRKDDDNKGKQLCVKVPPGHLIAPGWLKKDGERRTDAEERAEIAARNNSLIPVCKDLPKGIEDKLEGDWKKPTTTPPAPTPISAPEISAVSSTSTTASTTVISWNTNRGTTGKVWFGTTTPVNITVAPNASLTTYTLAHTVNLSNLASSTTYYFVVVSADEGGRTATSSQSSFTTLAQ